jgi:AbrB family looped-hinge helix DNA binding protein
VTGAFISSIYIQVFQARDATKSDFQDQNAAVIKNCGSNLGFKFMWDRSWSRSRAPGLTCRKYEFILLGMKMGERGQVTIPKKLRERFGLRPRIEVEFVDERGRLVLKKVEHGADPVEAVAGSCKGSLRKLGFVTADEYIEVLRGR